MDNGAVSNRWDRRPVRFVSIYNNSKWINENQSTKNFAFGAEYDKMDKAKG
jgi:hypothetical protein